jgi:hypothetical protein
MKWKCGIAIIAAVLFVAVMAAPVIASASDLTKDITISGSGQILSEDTDPGNGKEPPPGVGTVTKTSSSKTGDESDIAVHMIAMLSGLVILVFMLSARWHLEDIREPHNL